MHIDWKNKLRKIDFRHGLDRLYFVATLVWFIGWFIAFITEIRKEEVNIFADEPTASIIAMLLIALFPFIFYFLIIFLLNIFLWVISGFKGVDAKQIHIRPFVGESGFLVLSEGTQFYFL